MPGPGGLNYNRDTSIIVIDPAASTSLSGNHLGQIDHAGVDGLHAFYNECGNPLYSLDSTTFYEGNALRPADVFIADGTKILDADAAGIPAGVNINAVSRDPESCDLFISIDITAVLGGIAFRPDDVIRWNAESGFSLFFATGFHANIDALHYLSPSRLLISFDVGISLPDVAVSDDSVIEIGIGGDYQLLVFNPADLDTSWQGADLDSLWAYPAPIIDFIFADGFE